MPIDLKQREKYSDRFIDHDYIWKCLEEGKDAPKEKLRDILDKSREARGLEPEEVACLIQTADPDILEEMFQVAREVKEKIYGKRLVLFAPLYISNYCVNSCKYCGYHRENRALRRRRLEMDEIAEEVRILESLGHKRLAVECGEDPVRCPIEYVVESIECIYRTLEGPGSIRRVNVNIAATTVEEYRMLKAAKIGTYILFQETYHKPTYEQMHPSGPKSDYRWHLTAMDRAMEAGIDDVGIGALFGLFDYRFEVMGLTLHSRHLDRDLGVGPHTISFPRLRPASGVDLTTFPYLVDDDTFRKIVAVVRLAVPYTGMILSTRERPGYREEVIALGISQISAGSCTGVGAYRARFKSQEGQREAEDAETTESFHSGLPFDDTETSQFNVEDTRSPDEVIRTLCLSGYIPSYCTACYRKGRTGDRFMTLAKSGQIQNVCLPNAILTFKEYLMDYASEATKAAGEYTINVNLQEIPNEAIRRKTVERLAMIEKGQRDLYF